MAATSTAGSSGLRKRQMQPRAAPLNDGLGPGGAGQGRELAPAHGAQAMQGAQSTPVLVNGPHLAGFLLQGAPPASRQSAS